MSLLSYDQCTAKTGSASIFSVMDGTYQYNDDGRIRMAQDGLDNRFDRAYTYDHVGRVTQALTGHEARGEQYGQPSAYAQSYEYDAWNHLTRRSGRFWSQSGAVTATYQNDRASGGGYDAAGNMTSDGGTQHPQLMTYDAAGRQVGTQVSAESTTSATAYDGDGLVTKSTTQQGAQVKVSYQVHSTVLNGALLTQLDSSGGKLQTRVYAGGEEIAAQGTQSYEYVSWVTHNTVTGNESSFNGVGGAVSTTQLDPQGVDVGVYDPFDEVDPDKDLPVLQFVQRSYQSTAMGGCQVDFVAVPCGIAMRLVNSGAGVFGPAESVRSRYYNGAWHLEVFGTNPQTGQMGYQSWNNDVTRLAGGNYTPTGHSTGIDRNGNMVYGISDSGYWTFSNFDAGFALDGLVRFAGFAQAQRPPVAPGHQVPSGDPCAGNKGNLQYSPTRQRHIFDRHIRTDINPDASKYTFHAGERNGDQKFARVKSLNQQILMNATGYVSGRNIVYSYAFPVSDYTIAGIGLRYFEDVGTDRNRSFNITNVGTVIIRNDGNCNSVVTSHPGLPNPSSPVTGTPYWTDPSNGIIIH